MMDTHSGVSGLVSFSLSSPSYARCGGILATGPYMRDAE